MSKTESDISEDDGIFISFTISEFGIYQVRSKSDKMFSGSGLKGIAPAEQHPRWNPEGGPDPYRAASNFLY